MEYISNLFMYIISINVNAVTTICYALTTNWFLLVSVIFVIVFIYFELKEKAEENVFDERQIF